MKTNKATILLYYIILTLNNNFSLKKCVYFNENKRR